LSEDVGTLFSLGTIGYAKTMAEAILVETVFAVTLRAHDPTDA
jgi:hypothetical protein